jgi:hypothetical protein
MPWTSNGVDTNGNLNDFGVGLLAFQTAHPELVDPSSTTGMAPELKMDKSGSFLEKVYPNPSGSGIFNIVLLDYHDVILRITDEKGSIIFNKKAGSAETNFSSNGFPKGTYLLLAIKDGLVESRKLVLN